MSNHPYAGARVAWIGDSMSAYERVEPDGRDYSSSYVIRAITTLGGEVAGNHAIGGSMIAQMETEPDRRDPMVARYAAMPDDADLVIVAGGANDIGHALTPFGTPDDRTPHTFRGALHLLCEGLRHQYVGRQMLFVTPLRRYLASAGMTTPHAPNAIGRTPVEYVDAIIDTCAEWGIPVLDQYRTSILNPFVEGYREQYMTDGTHPNAAGHEIMATRLVNFLSQL